MAAKIKDGCKKFKIVIIGASGIPGIKQKMELFIKGNFDNDLKCF